MKKLKVNFWLMLFLFSVQLVFCQQMNAQIKGTVSDASGVGLPGVSIREKNSKNATISDLNGNFQLKNENPNGVLVFSFIGLESQEVSIKGKKTINVTLAETSENYLKDAVVVAYGTQKKVSVTGSISSVNTAQLKESPTADFVGALAGKLPGLTTIQNSGQPGEESYSIYLRGVSTTNDQSPLILIDGVPRDNISSLDPNEVASLSILKDASATAVFGVRGANGVILITTKRGENETPQLNVTAEYGIQDFATQPHSLDSWDWAVQRNQALINDGLAPAYSADQIQKYKSGLYPYMYPNNNWTKIMFKSQSPMTRYNLNITGGNDRVKYFLNTSYTFQNGMLNTESKDKLGYDPEYSLNRYNFRTNIDVKMSDWIKSSLNLSGYIDRVNTPASVLGGSVYWIVSGIYQGTPTMVGPTIQPGYGGQVGEVTTTALNSQPAYGNLNRTGNINSDRANLYSSLSFDFDLSKITKGLTSKIMVSFDSKSSTVITAKTDFTRYRYNITQTTDPGTGTISDNLLFYAVTPQQFVPLALSKTATFQYAINMQWLLNYARSFGKHQVTGMILAQRDNNESVNSVAGVILPSDRFLPYNVIGTAGRFTYNYDNRYLAEVNLGYNGSEQFAPGNRFGFFPAGSVGWVISNEKFMENQKIIDNLKFRASYGKVGSDKLGSTRFLYLDNAKVVSGGYITNGITSSSGYVSEALIGNPFITWETSYKQNYGIDLTILKVLKFTGEYYLENRDNILITPGNIPTMGGIPAAILPKLNDGVVNNTGYELQLTYNLKINKELSFNVSGNYNYNKNTVTNMDEAPNDPTYAYKYQQTGQSIGQNWGYIIDWNSPGHGYYTSQDEINKSGLKFDGIQPKPGDFVYKDINIVNGVKGDGIINGKDYAPIGYSNIPRISYGLTLGVSYKRFNFSAMFQGIDQASQYYNGWGVTEYDGDGNYYKYMNNAWTPALYNAGATISYPRLTTIAGGGSSDQPNSFFIEDRSYLRLKNVQISYTVPTKLSLKFGAKSIKFYVNGQNLILWDNLATPNFDPEQASATSMPLIRTINFGANILF